MNLLRSVSLPDFGTRLQQSVTVLLLRILPIDCVVGNRKRINLSVAVSTKLTWRTRFLSKTKYFKIVFLGIISRVCILATWGKLDDIGQPDDDEWGCRLSMKKSSLLLEKMLTLMIAFRPQVEYGDNSFWGLNYDCNSDLKNSPR